MNTLQPPKWRIYYEHGSFYGSADGPWSDIAHFTAIDGIMVYETEKPVEHIEIFLGKEGYCLIVTPPSPRPCFAYKRMAMSVINDEGKEPLWLYTCFGYIDGPSRVTLLVSPQSICSTSTPRSTPFSL